MEAPSIQQFGNVISNKESPFPKKAMAKQHFIIIDLILY
tara:strand:+ start:239 stop:355 length:117 start_codon:yes stop_codon:yes gene_type:complete